MTGTSWLTPEQEATLRCYRHPEEIVPRHWTQAAVEANGIRHHYYRSGGDKPALVLLHGFQDSALGWLRVATALQDEYDVVMIDARGHGRSDGVASGYSAEMLVEDAAGVIRALRLNRPIVLGHSMGGATAAMLAAAHPDLVRLALLEDPPWEGMPRAEIANSEGYRTWYQGWLDWMESLKTLSYEDQLIATATYLSPGSPLGPEEEYVAWVDACVRFDLDLARQGISLWSMPWPSMPETVARIACPVLLMRSASRFPVYGPPSEVEEEPSPLPHLTVLRFANTGHLIHREQLDRFIATVRAFLARHR